MSHEIDFTNTRLGAAVYANVEAWHGHGTVLDHAPSAAEAITAAHLDWKVEKRAAYFVGDDGGMVRIPGMAHTVRVDAGVPLGYVSEGFSILQNDEAFLAVDAVLQEEGIVYEAAGALQGGRRVWLLARNPEATITAGGDKVDPYFLLYNGHDGLTTLTMTYTGVRVVCKNTVDAALAESGAKKSGVRIRHTASMTAKIASARAAFDKIKAAQAAFAAKADALAAMTMSASQVGTAISRSLDVIHGPLAGEALVDAILANPVNKLRAKRRDEAADTVYNLTKRELADAGTDVANAWLVANAITEYDDCRATFRGDSDTQTARRFDTMVFGDSAKRRHQIFELVEKVASA